MKRLLRTIERASEELSEAVRWYEDQQPGLGAEFLDAVTATIALIEAHPEMGAVMSRAGQTRRALVPRFPYRGLCPSQATSGLLEETSLSN